jgi:hypothetical protein
MIKRTGFIALLFLLIFSCKKPVSSVNTDYVGKWVGYELACGYYYLEIGSDDHGAYGTIGGHGCGNSYSGMAKLNKKHLFIGHTKFLVLQAPSETTDSVTTPETSGAELKVKALKVMRLRNSVFHGNTEIIFYKYE